MALARIGIYFFGRSMNSSCRAWHPFVLDAGGACGFKNVNLPPFSAMTSCGNEPLFKDGKGCGSCYQVVHYLVRDAISRTARCAVVCPGRKEMEID